jgi:hypothetical protein
MTARKGRAQLGGSEGSSILSVTMNAPRAALVLALLLACKRTPPAPPAPPPPSATTPAPAPTPVAEGQVKALLDEWLAAQNAGSFERYQKLYASKFQGVRRSGPRTVRLDRPGWVADRKRMFGKAMTVEIADLEIVRGGGMARVQFQQTWASGNYKDVGRKQMVLVREGEGLRVAREELLDSRIVGADHRDLSAALLLADATSVLLEARPQDAWAQGPPRPREGDQAGVRSVDVAALPAELAGWRTRKLKLMGKAGPLCDGAVAGLSIVGLVTPHFGTVQTWEGREDGQRWSADRIAADMWSMSKGDGRVLVGELAQKCDGALWAFDANKTVPVVAPANEMAPGPLRDTIIKAFRQLPQHAEIQKAWREYPEKDKEVWTDSPDARTVVWRFDHPRATLVMVSAAWLGGCGSFGGDVTALYQLAGPAASPTRTLLSAMSYGDLAAPVSAFDLDGDGQLEILFGPEGWRKERGLYQLAGDAYDRFVLYQQPFHDCGC